LNFDRVTFIDLLGKNWTWHPGNVRGIGEGGKRGKNETSEKDSECNRYKLEPGQNCASATKPARRCFGAPQHCNGGEPGRKHIATPEAAM